MTAQELKEVVLTALTQIAPEVRGADIQPAANLREQCDLDSVDFLNFMVALHERLGVNIPEADYARLATLDSAVAYLAGKTASAGTLRS
jgi:acyl carrier protein